MRRAVTLLLLVPDVKVYELPEVSPGQVMRIDEPPELPPGRPPGPLGPPWVEELTLEGIVNDARTLSPLSSVTVLTV